MKDTKVLISYGRKLELEAKEKELARLKQEGNSSPNVKVVEAIYNHIGELMEEYKNGVGGRAAKYHAMADVRGSIRKHFLDIPPIGS